MAQVLSCEFYKIFKKTYFIENLQATAFSGDVICNTAI